MDELTYDEWNSLGYYVNKGEKSNSRNEDGIPVFSEEQVTAKFSNRSCGKSYKYYYDDVDYDDPMAFDPWMFN